MSRRTAWAAAAIVATGLAWAVLRVGTHSSLDEHPNQMVGSEGNLKAGGPLKEYVARVVAPLRDVALVLRRTDALAGSYLGGRPPLQMAGEWPEHGGRPLTFLACIDLAECGALDWLPSSGRLLFFYDTKDEPWGAPEDAGGWAVRLVAQGSTDTETLLDAPEGIDKVLPRCDVALEPKALPPDWDLTPLSYDSDLSEEQTETACMLLAELLDQEYPEPRHHIGGHVQAHQQADMMPLECELHARGWRDLDALSDEDRSKVEDGARAWRLLLQIDSDPALGLGWAGYDGRLFYWVRDSDAREGRFDKVWITFNR